MKITHLENTGIEQIVACLLIAFESYFVPMPTHVEFWRKRFKNARVDKALSWGVFEDEKLVGFIINAVDHHNDLLVAFNTGTGVLPPYRGNQLVDKMYDYGLPILQEKGIQKCSLEVIDKNIRAIKVYERIGFQKRHQLLCFKGQIPNQKSITIDKKEVTLKAIQHYQSDANYSWDNRWATIQMAKEDYAIFEVSYPSTHSPFGYFIINPSNGYIAQLETTNDDWASLFSAIGQVQKNIRINNIKEDRTQLIAHLRQSSFEHTINQIEMERVI